MNLKNTNAANLIFQKKLRELNVNPEELVKVKKSDKQDLTLKEYDNTEEVEEDIFFTKLGNKV